MKTLLITGATGFIGHHLVEQVIGLGFRVIASARISSNINWLEKQNIPVVMLSLGETEKLMVELNSVVEEYGEIDVVIHNAGVTQSLKEADYYAVNYVLTKNLITALATSSSLPPKFIFVSSIAAVGPGDAVTFVPIREDDSPHPVTHYGNSKLLAEQFIMAQKQLSWIIVRPTIVYGPHEKNFFNMIKAINKGFELYIGSQKQMLSFIHVKDLADVLIRLIVTNLSREVYNLSDGEAYSVINVNQIIKSELNKKTRIVVLPVSLVRLIAFYNEILGRFALLSPILTRDKVKELKQLNWLCDNSKIKRDVGFSPAYYLEEGMTKTIKWYKKNDWL
ncbi:MAG: NAD(P)-dependent oxidoreductase [Bacteroidetes bacterium]|nr:NAD(P)-dependent oxidoreductase [Bacteroidota bacterium]MBL6944117.1 NAD(P)-dependent oxidoreductase [Bacteroidales bacterium]